MELRQYVTMIWKWLWLIVLATVIAAGSSYWASQSVIPVYQSAVTLMVGQVIQNPNATSQDLFTSQQLGQTYAQMAMRQPILQATVDALDLGTSWMALKGRVNASLAPQTQLLGIRVLDTDPQRAMITADEIAQQLILQSPTTPDNIEREEHREFVEKQIASLRSKIEAAEAQIVELEEALREAFSARQIQDLQGQINMLQGLINSWQGNYAQFLDFSQGSQPNYLTIIEPATLPTSPINQRTTMNMLLAAAIGLSLAVGAAFLLEYLDDTIKTTDDVVETLALSPLGAITRMTGQGYENKLVTSQHPRSPISEAFRSLRTNIQFSTLDKPAKTLLVTSPNPVEGKSVTAANLAVVMAQAGLKTLLVDSDLRRPALHKIFQSPNQSGLTTMVLQEDLSSDGHLQATEMENLHLLTSGPIPPNPSELLGSRKMQTLMEKFREEYDIVVLDSPPVLAVTDASVLATQVDGVLIVADSGRTRRDVALRARDNLVKVGANILGVALNRMGHRAGGYYYYYYYYSRDDGDGSHQKRRHRNGGQWWQHIPLIGRLGRK